MSPVSAPKTRNVYDRRGGLFLVMSLTSVLKSDQDLASRLANLLPVAGAPYPQELPLLAPPRTKNYALVGTAFDYLFRFEVQRRNPSANEEEWVATLAVDRLGESNSEDGLVTDKTALKMYSVIMKDENISEVWDGTFSKYVKVGEEIYHVSKSAEAKQAANVLAKARSAHRRFLRTRNPSEEQVSEIASHSLRLAKLDRIFREGFVDPALGSVDSLDVDDLLRLWKVIPFDGPMSVCLGKNVWLNPTFGRFSRGMGGADADVVASTMLIDIKTSIHPDIRLHGAQLIGYAMLAQAYRDEEAPNFPAVDSVGVYFSRQGTLVALPMEPVRKAADFKEAFGALMAHCVGSRLSHTHVRLKKTTSKPESPPSRRLSRKRSR